MINAYTMYAFIFCFVWIFGILFLFLQGIFYAKTLYKDRIKCYNVVVLCLIILYAHAQG